MTEQRKLQIEEIRENVFIAFLKYEIEMAKLTISISSAHAIAIYDIALTLWKKSLVVELDLSKLIRFFMMNPTFNYSLFKCNEDELAIMIGGL